MPTEYSAPPRRTSWAAAYPIRAAITGAGARRAHAIPLPSALPLIPPRTLRTAFGCGALPPWERARSAVLQVVILVILLRLPELPRLLRAHHLRHDRPALVLVRLLLLADKRLRLLHLLVIGA